MPFPLWFDLSVIIAMLVLFFLLTALTQRKQNEKVHHALTQFREQTKGILIEQRSLMDQRQLESLKLLQESIQLSFSDVRTQVNNILMQSTERLAQQFDRLNTQVEKQLETISLRVDERLQKGFEKTTETFQDVIKRLVIIDEAQKRISELSSSVVSLQDILLDKKARGAFGEVQLAGLIRNVMPEKSFAFQYTLSNGKRADCILFLPSPTGNLVIDAKFPLENYRRLQSCDDEIQRKQLAQQFRQDMKKHILDIHQKYIIPAETAEGAILFIPAESIFAEIHSHYADIVEESHQHRVWLTSPTTLMAILTTARAAIKDADTRKQVHVIQEHLGYLGKDFERFRERMNNLVKHLDLAQKDVKDVHVSAQKIANRFGHIERVELELMED